MFQNELVFEMVEDDILPFLASSFQDCNWTNNKNNWIRQAD